MIYIGFPKNSNYGRSMIMFAGVFGRWAQYDHVCGCVWAHVCGCVWAYMLIYVNGGFNTTIYLIYTRNFPTVHHKAMSIKEGKQLSFEHHHLKIVYSPCCDSGRSSMNSHFV